MSSAPYACVSPGVSTYRRHRTWRRRRSRGRRHKGQRYRRRVRPRAWSAADKVRPHPARRTARGARPRRRPPPPPRRPPPAATPTPCPRRARLRRRAGVALPAAQPVARTQPAAAPAPAAQESRSQPAAKCPRAGLRRAGAGVAAAGPAGRAARARRPRPSRRCCSRWRGKCAGQLGGIYTVLKTKAGSMLETWRPLLPHRPVQPGHRRWSSRNIDLRDPRRDRPPGRTPASPSSTSAAGSSPAARTILIDYRTRFGSLGHDKYLLCETTASPPTTATAR